jgi:hypothetical protein
MQRTVGAEHAVTIYQFCLRDINMKAVAVLEQGIQVTFTWLVPSFTHFGAFTLGQRGERN